MTLTEIARALAESCREGRERETLDTLYAEHALSVEPDAPEGQDRIARGRDAIHAKHVWWETNATVHAAEVAGPFVGGDDAFALIFDVDATVGGTRMQLREVGVYTVKDGLIVREEFLPETA